MNVNAKNVTRILEHLALQNATDHLQHGVEHGCMICSLPIRSWQADMIRNNPHMPEVHNPSEFRRAMKDPAMPVIFVPDTAIMTPDALERICRENPLNKMIIWERN